MLTFLLISYVLSTTLTTRVLPHERTCFYAATVKKDERVGFYFSVQQGGSFDIDWDITGPNNKRIINGIKERNRDLVFNAKTIGEYSFCFSNLMSTFAEKVVDFDVTTESETRPDHPSQQNPLLPVVDQEKVKKDTSVTEQSLNRIDSGLNTFTREQKYYRTRQNRNFDTVLSTESRIFWFGIVESILMMSVSVIQVLVVKSLFTASAGRKTRI